MVPRTSRKMSRFQKRHIMTELKTNMTRNVPTPKPLSQAKIEANPVELKAHYTAINRDDRLDDIVAKLHPTVQCVYRLLEGQTTTIVAAIDGRADVIDTKLDQHSAKLDQQMRVMRGQLSPEDSDGLTDHELLAQNCQSVRSMQSQNIQLRARIKGVAVPCDLEERTKRLEDLEAKKAAKMADNEMRKANIAQKKLDMAQKKTDKQTEAAEKKANKTPKTQKSVLKKVPKKNKPITLYFVKPGEKNESTMEDTTPPFAVEVEEEFNPKGVVVGECDAVTRLF